MEETNKLTRMRRVRERMAYLIYGIGEWICRRADRVYGIRYPSGPPKTREPIELANCCHIPIVIAGSGMYLAESARDVDLMCKDCGQVWNVQFKAESDVATIKPIYIVDKILVRPDDEEMVLVEGLTENLAKTEQMADHAHEVWTRWAEYMLDNLTPENIGRWRNQIGTLYSELSEEDKEKDRKIYYEWVSKYTMHLRPDPQGEGDIGREGENSTQESNQTPED